MSSRKRVPPQADFGRALQQLRAARGLVQEDMVLATSRRHISRIEQGHQVPSIRTIEVLAEQIELAAMDKEFLPKLLSMDLTLTLLGLFTP